MKLTFKNLFFIEKEMFPVEKQLEHEKHHKRNAWVYFATMVLGFWLIANPLTFEYEQPLMIWNDYLVGALLIMFSYFALKPYNLWAQWAIVFLGIWLFIAPLIFHVREETAYLLDFLIGTLAITFGIAIASQPGIKLFALPGPSIPQGWSYNPSSWSQRIPVIFLAWLGFFIARYMGAFQMEMIQSVWDPFFGDGTRDVLKSDVSESFPVSDAALGAMSYILDVLFGYVGGIHRWRTMPWVVIVFAILIIPLGVVSITLIILQPLSVGSWCTLCLASAAISLIMIPFTIDEAMATIQMMIQQKKKGKSLWRILWFGCTMDDGDHKDKEEPEVVLKVTAQSMVHDLLLRPWNLVLITLIAIWIMISPSVLQFSGSLADSNHLVGALIITFTVISMSEVARTLRFINILFGLWLAISPFIYNVDQSGALWNGIISGLVIIAVVFPRGIIEDQRGGFAKYVK